MTKMQLLNPFFLKHKEMNGIGIIYFILLANMEVSLKTSPNIISMQGDQDWLVYHSSCPGWNRYVSRLDLSLVLSLPLPDSHLPPPLRRQTQGPSEPSRLYIADKFFCLFNISEPSRKVGLWGIYFSFLISLLFFIFHFPCGYFSVLFFSDASGIQS